MKGYDHKKIEERWQLIWEEKGQYNTQNEVPGKENHYVLVEFPYPSGNLHVGHWYAFAVTDIYARWMRMKGKNVLYPIGFDSFGLPAENAAIKRGLDPREWTYSNIEYMRGQLRSMGASFDWSREVRSSDPEYYKWTQYIFTRFFEKGLAYQKEATVNWCPSCQTVLANEQVVQGQCERCQTEVEQRTMKQWFLKITEYADRLLDDLDTIDWPVHIKDAQRNWIGKSEGASFTFKLNNIEGQQDGTHSVHVFTTRPDTFFGVTFLVVSPEKAQEWIDIGWKASHDVVDYVANARRKPELERQENKEKTGVDTGIKAVHPGTGEEIPVWVADYVLGSYGTGAVMAVPAHDERDYEFAKKFDLPIKPVVLPHRVDTINPPVEGKKKIERRTIHAIVRNPKTGKYLCLNWKKHPWTTFIVGGVEDGEDIVDAATREIVEEAGYKNVKFVRELGHPVCGEYFAAHKDENRVAITTALLFDLEDEEKEQISADELEKHEVVWKSLEEITPETFTCAELDLWLERLEEVDREDVYSGEGILYGSGEFSSLSSIEAAEKITETFGEKKVTFRLRDWSIGRQRYWGCPIPVVYDPEGNAHPVPIEHLPWTLPGDVDHTPSGEAPLARSKELKDRTVQIFGKGWTPEVDTMDTFVDSSWYYLRYLDPHNDAELASMNSQKKWMPVDFYSGGAEHTTLHLLYSRFFYKVLSDLGLVEGDEPFMRRLNRGLILGPDGQKMSKSRGNVVDPDEQVERVGSDTVRAYLSFIGPYNEAGSYPWDLGGIAGVRRFIERVWVLQYSVDEDIKPTDEVERLAHQTIARVTTSMESLKFNTALSALMEFVNVLGKEKKIPIKIYETLLILLAPIAPHITEELWNVLGYETSVHDEMWPVWDPQKAEESTVVIVVQINGKVREQFEAQKGSTKEELEQQARRVASSRLEGAELLKVIVVPDKLVNFVVSM